MIFLLDGGETEDFHHITGLARINAAWGQGQEVIVVGIEGVDRRRDLTFPSSVEADRKLLPTSGGAARYRRFLVEELAPWVEQRWRTSGRKALMGESLAGLFTAQTLVETPEAFDDYVVVSPSLWWSDGALADRAAAALAHANLAGRRVFVAFDEPAPPADTAARERALQDRFAAALATRSDLAAIVVRPREGHGSIYHPAAMLAFRRFFGAGPAR